MTFPKRLEDSLLISSELDVPYDEGLLVGYKRFDELGIEPLFPFGHGLTYTTFEAGDLSVRLEPTARNWTSIECNFTLTNTGDTAAAQVVQLYISYPDAANEPPKLLKAFEKLFLESGESQECSGHGDRGV